MDPLLLALPVLLTSAFLIYWSGRRHPTNVPFLAGRLCVLLGVFVAWCWAFGSTSTLVGPLHWKLLVFAPASAALTGLVGLDVLRYHTGRAAS